MKRIVLPLPVLFIAAFIAGCADEDAAPSKDEPRPVLTSRAKVADIGSARLSGTVRARYETPVSFQVGGRILERRVDAGDRVVPGEELFRLDPQDFEQAVAVARAEFQAARAELETARAETRRNRDLLARDFISDQVFERVQLVEKSARERVQAAQARLDQAENQLGYTELAAGREGLLIEVTGEPGQVVAAGQAVGVIALEGEKEVEVFLPERFGVPESGHIVADGRAVGGLSLREAAGAADDVTRTWKARYSIAAEDPSPRLGQVVKVALDTDGVDGDVLEVPAGAINERGHGPQVWIIRAGQARPVRVTLLDMDTENARILADPDSDAGPDGDAGDVLGPGTPVIALGTHLLQSGMAVRELE
ncbi:MAG: efflux RND transporter periplasmic adaptor subunit [Wenzhouxiangellaceae bacterium]|nr:efflux RND transporter periplasmic adaptor subunit [Wenzhouxiangellaceae bacterium]MBS3746022.1 efflux RND transporter periplasmic adaptor subunit [Wenzhouxiangellaceae bacterium]MBS3822384.1 efflux RND transporter periplasmic adaptor subunit [Wenzhouxiangellaceae bacterium]